MSSDAPRRAPHGRCRFRHTLATRNRLVETQPHPKQSPRKSKFSIHDLGIDRSAAKRYIAAQTTRTLIAAMGLFVNQKLTGTASTRQAVSQIPNSVGFRSAISIVAILVVAMLGADYVIADEIAHYKAGVVKIISIVDGKPRTGTGIILRLDASGAHILTAAHVVEGDPAPQIVFFTGQDAPAIAEVRRIEGGDPGGLALLVVRRQDAIPPRLTALALDPSIVLNGGDALTIIGFPQGGGSWALGVAHFSGREGRDLILAGAVEEGHSGGPVLKDGKVVGIVMATANRYARAVPAALVQLVLDGWQEGVEASIAANTARVPSKKGLLSAELEKTKLAFVDWNPNTDLQLIYLMNADGTHLAPLIDDSNRDQVPATCHDGRLPYMDSPSWSPDASKLAFAVRVYSTDGSEECPASPHGEIFTIDADGSGARRLTRGGADNREPAWSPDGSKIAFASGDEYNRSIYVMKVDGSDPTRLTINQNFTDSYPAWSPDGTQIAFVSQGEHGKAIYIVNADGSNRRRLTNPTYFVGKPAWSSDASRIAFALSRGEDQNADIYVINVNDAHVQRLTHNDKSTKSYSPTWSPDSTMIAYASGRVEGTHIHLANQDGSNAFQLRFDPIEPWDLAWSPFQKK